MNEQEQKEAALGRWADEVLRQLPGHRAPASLLPRVRTAVMRLRTLPWYQRPWLQWPLGFRLMSLFFAAGFSAILSSSVLPHVPTAPTASEIVPGYAPVVSLANATAATARAVEHAIVHSDAWIVALILGVLAALWFLALGLGTACWRLAIQEH